MPADAKWYLICYDIRDEKRLRKAAKHLEGYGERVQYSIFRCWLGYTQMQQLRCELTQKLTEEDDVLIIPLCSRCVGGLEVTHTTSKKPDWPDAPARHKIV